MSRFFVSRRTLSLTAKATVGAISIVVSVPRTLSCRHGILSCGQNCALVLDECRSWSSHVQAGVERQISNRAW
ncbi:hypothetical protein PR003_g31016 [Phytophthora rubi]|uniref:Uncharacterized protein n=1 Tax=Phytophthora rubi TaxID=129364 RepID=A0A6A4BD42_9STRA|nr:hypothetical protein PR003_g31016 [Phytophthora rubi]